MARGLIQSIFGTGFSRVMGAARDIAIGHVFGAGRVSDAFWVAFTVPSVFRRFVADEGLTGVLVPAIQQAEEESGKPAGKQLARTALAVLLVACIVLCIGGIIGAPWLVRAFAFGFTDDPEQFALTVRLTRWLFPFVLLVSVLSWCEGLLNIRRHFFLPKMAPGFVGGAMAASALLLASHFEEPTMALVLGTLVGGVIQVLVCLPLLIRMWGFPVPDLRGLRSSQAREFIGRMGEVVVIGIFAQLNILVLRLLASLLEPGSVTHYHYATRVVDLAQGIIAVGVGSAALPELAAAVAGEKLDDFRDTLHQALRLAAVLLIPSAAFTAVLAQPVTSVLFLHGEFSLEDAEATAHSLQMMIPFMLALGAVQIFKRAYFALNDLKMLMMVGFVGVLLTASLGHVFASRHGVAGLAAGLSLATVAQALAYAVALSPRSRISLQLSTLLGPLARMTLAALPAAALVHFLGGMGHWESGPSGSNFLWLGIAGIAGFSLYAVIASQIGVPEMRSVLRRLRILK